MSCEHLPGADGRSRCRCPWRWTAEVVIAGQRRQQSGLVHGGTAAEANRRRLAALHELQRSPVARRGVLLGDALEAWLARKVKAGAIKPSTAVSYGRHLSSYLVPTLGRVRLSELNVRHLDHLQDELQRLRPDMSAATRSRVAATLRSFVRDAYRRGELADDPTRRAEPIKVKRPRVTVWEAEQFGRFVDWAEASEERLAAVVQVAALTGLRRGELCGLRWVDVDLERARIVVAQQVVQLGAQQLISTPKTAAGELRVVDLDPDTLALLRRVLEQQDRERAEWGSDYREHGLVFAWQDGRPFSPEDLTRRFPRLVRRFNEDPERIGGPLPRVRFHDMRHLQASLLIAAGVPLPVVSKRLGHSSVQITSDTYGHLLDGVGAAAAAAAAALIPRRPR